MKTLLALTYAIAVRGDTAAVSSNGNVITSQDNATACVGTPDDELCKILHEYYNEPARKHEKTVTMEHIAADDWEKTLELLQRQAVALEVRGPFRKKKLEKGGRLEKAFRDISGMPHLRHLKVDPHDDPDTEFTSPLHMSWLLSESDKLESLSISNLDVHNQEHVDMLALAFSKCTSLKQLEIAQLLIGYRDVTTIVPFVEALAKLPLERVHLELDAFGAGELAELHAQESLTLLQKVPGLSKMIMHKHPAPHYGNQNYRILTNRDTDTWEYNHG